MIKSLKLVSLCNVCQTFGKSKKITSNDSNKSNAADENHILQYSLVFVFFFSVFGEGKR